MAAVLVAGLVGLFLLGPSSPLAQAAPATPEVTAGFQTTERLVLTVNLPAANAKANGTLLVELVDPQGEVLDSASKDVTLTEEASSQRFEFTTPKLNPDKVTVRCRLDKQEHKVELKNVLLVKPHETALSAGKEFFAGSDAALRCEVHGVKSITQTVPLVGASVTIRLKGQDGKIFPVFEGKAGADGVAAIQFKVPEKAPAGAYKLEVATKSTLGEEKLEQDVKIKSAPRVLLVTDKPLYQPGQRMHIRALALQAFTLHPVAGSNLIFEVEDAKGNKVFKQTHKTSDHGIASVDFQLADEVNTGDYHVRAILGEHQSDKTVTVKPYVLPKFKSELKADKHYYLPKESLHADLQIDYFFGKPVAGGKVKVTASTFDVAFKDFQTWEGKTDAQGHAKFDIKLPDYFVGQPLNKGNALVKLEAKVTDTADHTETITRTYPVSAQPIQVSLIAEGGRLVPDMENHIFAAAVYPDGSPAAQCAIKVWHGPAANGKALAEIKTNEAGLAEFTVSPKAGQFRQGPWMQRNIEMLGGQQTQAWGPQQLFDLTAEARDAHGDTAKTTASLSSEPFGENVLLRLDKAIYKGGEPMHLDIRSSAGMPTVYLDVVKSGQTLLTKWLDVKKGKAEYKLDLPASVFGTLEIHAYQTLASGEIIRDSRVAYVNPAADLKIDVQADKDTYLPGEKGTIRFAVTDSAGKPAAAALGVLIVDEAVYALQEMQPGLEKVFFTLQEELLKPRVQAKYKPSETIDNLVRAPALPAARQQIAQVLLTAIKPKPPAHWEVNPVVERQRKMEGQISLIGNVFWQYAVSGKPVLAKDGKSFRPDLLDDLVKAKMLDAKQLTDPVGGKLTLETLSATTKDFTAEHLGRAVTVFRMQQILWPLANYTQGHQAQWFKDGKWTLPESALSEAVKARGVQVTLQDAWGKPIKLVKTEKKRDHQTGWSQLDYYDLVSAGADGKFGTADDVKLPPARQWHLAQFWWLGDESRQAGQIQLAWRRNRQFNEQFARPGGMPMRGGFGGGRGMPMPMNAPGMPVAKTAARAPMDKMKELAKKDSAPPAGGDVAGGSAPPRLREFFPETLLWQPALITDEQGRATLSLDFADSITTWRLTASASSRHGLLGGATKPLRVFQDFFVDLDLPIALTQNDEVAFPVAVYNYLKTPQTVKLDLQPEPWFELVDGLGLSRSLDLKANEVTSVKFRIRAKKIGHFPLTVKASGTKMSDAIKRGIDVVPDGKKIEQVVTDRLSGKVTQTITIPDNAIPDASKLFVKVYPGVFSQILEGAEGILRMPGGCFEQTSSSAYPNVLVVDYIKKVRISSPEMLMKSENYLNIGYQRLLTFERPGGGFDWWGSGEPLIWLSAYGLQEFNDMSKVYPIDRGVIDRTQKWLMAKRDKDGTWSNIGATHSETIARMGDPKLLLTSYVVWSLLDSGLKTPELKSAVEYIRTHVKDEENAYILALAANALASWDAKDDSTHEVLTKILKKLDAKKQDVPNWKACCFPTGGHSLTYARGDSLTVETTALTVLAMLKNGQFTNSANKALAYLVKSKGPSGTWGSTSATILSLKALVAASGGTKHKGVTPFAVLVNGKEVKEGKVTEENADVMQLFDLKEHLRGGANEVTLQVKGETNLMYQIVGRHFEPWKQEPPSKSPFEVTIDYDRTKLSTADLLRVKATLKYTGKVPTSMVMLDLGIPPGFTVDAGDFAEMVGAKKIKRFSLTARQVILYLGDAKPGDVQSFEYTLKPKYPIKAKTPSSVAYEYYTPTNRATAKPVELVVEDKK